MSAFTKLQDFLAELEATKQQLNDQKITLIMQRQTKAAEIDEALLTGDGADIQSALDKIDSDLAALEQRISVIDATLNGKRQSPALTAIVWDVINESREGIGKRQLQWDEAAKELARIDEARLTIVAKLGEIAQDAQHLSNRASQAAEHLPRGAKPGAPSLATGLIIRHDRKSGIIFPDMNVIEKTFQGR